MSFVCNMGPITKSVQTAKFANLLYFDHYVKLTQVITCMVQQKCKIAWFAQFCGFTSKISISTYFIFSCLKPIFKW